MTRAVLALLGAILLTALIGCDGGGDERVAAARAPDPVRAHGAPARAFLDRYVGRDGRVVRRDQGGDTVSEGQAYALLLTVALGDRERFDRVWGWTRRELQRDDGLLAWRWADGAVRDRQPAADADVDAARALRLAAGRFADPALAREARRMTRAIERKMTRDGRLVAGPWARSAGIENPSYASPRAAALLGVPAIGRLARWRGRLPSDWARGSTPISPPGTHAPPRYGFDAVRTPIRLAESCRARDRRVAAELWPVLRRDAGRLPRDVTSGRPVAGAQLHPVALVGAAAAAQAAGATDDARRLLQLARARDAERPTYYGAAWVALGRIMLRSPLLGSCS